MPDLEGRHRRPEVGAVGFEPTTRRCGHPLGLNHGNTLVVNLLGVLVLRIIGLRRDSWPGKSAVSDVCLLHGPAVGAGTLYC